MKGRSSPNFILGFTDTETVMLDFDHTNLETVKYWARRIMKYFKLQGFLIQESSEGCYHVVFNRRVSWSESLSIVGRVVLMTHHKNLKKWHLMQCVKQSMTIRVSPKGDKPSPRIVFSEGKQDGQIAVYLQYRSLIRNIMVKLFPHEHTSSARVSQGKAELSVVD